MKVLETKKENILSQIEKVKELEDKHEHYNFYLDAVKRDGVPYELIQKSLYRLLRVRLMIYFHR